MPATKKKAISLSFKSTEVVVVTPDDEDRFMTTAREAAHACSAAEDQKEWQDTFEQFLAHLNACCATFGDAVKACYVSAGDDGLRVFMATPGEDYDLSIADRITEIDVDLAKKFPRCPADCVQVPSKPPGSLDSFFSVENSLKVYGELRNASR